MRSEIRIAGFGGQGVISMGILIASALGKYDDKQVAQTQSYGPEARGGACKAEIVIDDNEIDYIKVLNPDVFVAMSQPALDKYQSDLDPEKSLLIVDETLISNIPNNVKKVYKVPVTKIAEEQLEMRVVANVVMFGVLANIAKLSYEACKKAIEANMPPKFIEKNLQAFDIGYKIQL